MMNNMGKEKDQYIDEFQKFIKSVASMIAEIVEIRDPYLIGHHQRVSKLATAIAQEINLPQDKIEGVKIASLVHNVGKVNLPTEIVTKPTNLVEVELNLVKNHPRTGYEILRKVDFPWPVAEIVFQYQEKIDGSGYPRGLKGAETLIEAKILGVANTIEAMTSNRSYRLAFSINEALTEITKHKNVLFDPEVVDSCIRLFKEKEFQF